jgi:hypothetical protein
MKMSVKLLAAAFLFAGFAVCASADTTWVVDATFTYPSNGNTNTATGTFTLDPSLNIVTWNIAVAGSNTLADNTYTPGDSFLVLTTFDTTHIDFYDVTTNQYINLYLASPVSNAGGTINLLAGDSAADKNSTVVCNGCGVLDEGTISTTPEPLSLLLFGTGLVAIMGIARRRLKQSDLLKSPR